MTKPNSKYGHIVQHPDGRYYFHSTKEHIPKREIGRINSQMQALSKGLRENDKQVVTYKGERFGWIVETKDGSAYFEPMNKPIPYEVLLKVTGKIRKIKLERRQKSPGVP